MVSNRTWKTSNSKIDDLLDKGFTYKEIVQKTGYALGTIARYNREKAKIWMPQKFLERVEREGIPDRLTIPANFCNWFVGFFEGEGTFCFNKVKSYNRYHYGFHYGLTITQRAIEENLMKYIGNQFDIKSYHWVLSSTSNRYQITFHVQRLPDLVEVFIPLFEQYPLRSKRKRAQYTVWKKAILFAYKRSLRATLRGGFHLSEKEYKLLDQWNSELREINRSFR